MTNSAEYPIGSDRAATSGSWLSLLIEEQSPHTLLVYRDLLISRGMESAVVDEQLDIALRISANLDQRRRKAAELAALNEIASSLAAVTDTSVLLQEIVGQVKKLLQVDLAYLSLIDGQTIKIVVTAGHISSYLGGLTMPVEEGFGAAVISSQAPVWTSDYPHDTRFAHHRLADSAAALEDIRGLLGVPLSVGGRVSGVLFAAKRQERTFVSDEIELLASLASHAALALANARALSKQKQSTDELHAANMQLEAILAWDKTLTHAVLRGGDTPDFLAEIDNETGGTTYFLSRTSPIPTELARIDATELDQILGLSIECKSSRTFDVDGGSTLIAMPVLVAGEALGVLTLHHTADHETAARSAMLLERAAPFMALLLAGRHAAAQAAEKAKDDGLVDLLTRPMGSSRESVRLARLVGIDPANSHCVVVILPDEDNTATRNLVEDIEMPRGSVTANYGRRVLLVIPSTNADDVAEKIFDSASLPATVAISDAAREIAGLRKAFRDAEQTVGAMLSLNRRGQVGTAERLGVYRILLSESSPRAIERLFLRHLGAVAREEEASGVPLLRSIEAYLRNSQRHAVTASELGIHSNTLYQRLEKISHLLGDDWRKADRALDLQVILRLRSASELGRSREV